jgi:hypothetical protein
MECTRSEGKPVTFKSERSLRRHLNETKKHNAPPSLGRSCGTEVNLRALPSTVRPYASPKEYSSQIIEPGR